MSSTHGAECSLPLRGSYRRREDNEAMIQRLRFHAEQGEDKSQYLLGVQLNSGVAVPKDEAEAARWFLKAAEQGYAQAQYMLGLCYFKGHGVSENAEEAVRWFRKAAEQGNARAQNELAFCYYLGKGVAKDYQECLRWDRLAAEQGDADAQYNLGCYYSIGDVVPRDEDQAVRWLQKAADQGDKDAQALLNQLLQNEARSGAGAMTLKDADLVFSRMRALMMGEIGVGQPKMVRLSSFGNGALSRGGIIKAISLMIAYQYWCRHVTKENLESWPEWLSAAGSMIGSVLAQVCPDSDFDDLSDVNEGSPEYVKRSHKMFCAAYAIKDEVKQAETAQSLANFLTSLDVWSPEEYWQAVYSRLQLQMPAHDPWLLTNSSIATVRDAEPHKADGVPNGDAPYQEPNISPSLINPYGCLIVILGFLIANLAPTSGVVLGFAFLVIVVGIHVFISPPNRKS